MLLTASFTSQPPSGGCELKLSFGGFGRLFLNQPPSGGCELKRVTRASGKVDVIQPPSGGCELKLSSKLSCYRTRVPAAFGRL